MIKRHTHIRYWYMLLTCILVLLCSAFTSYGSEQQAAGSDSWETSVDQYDLEEIQQFLNRQQEGTGWNLSFSDLMKDLMAGRFMEVLSKVGTAMKDSLFSEVSSSSRMLGQIIVLGIIGAVFTNFSSVFNSSQISETGFFVTYLLLFTFLASSFFTSIQIASQVLEQVLEFMQALIPAYFLAAAFAGGSVSSAALYEFTLITIAVVQWLFFKVLIPMVRVYILLVLASHIAKEDMLSKLTDLLKAAIQWSLKTLVGLVLGFHMIQGLVLPYVDSMKNATVQKFIQVIPGIGQGASAVTQLMLGSGVLIKNTIGAAAVVILVVITAVPVLKLIIMMILYQITAAAMQPVCDKRIVSCVSSVAQGHKLLLSIVLAAALLFIITIAVVCAATNVTFYAGG